jgi:hypothetical protein
MKETQHLYESLNSKDATSNCSPEAHPDLPAKDSKTLHLSRGGCDDWKALDTSVEQNAALVWPKCERPCPNCQTCHVAIPGSNLSESCIRVSLSICGLPTPIDRKMQCQNILIPADKYELSVLGWLIWSTYEQQLALRDSTIGRPPKIKCQSPRDYIYTKVGYSYDEVLSKTSRSKHYTKPVFEGWWDGKKNLRRFSGKRWLVVTFPCDMGRFDILDATFGAMGLLFRLPTLVPVTRIGGNVTIGRSVEPATTSRGASLELMEDREAREVNDFDCGISPERGENMKSLVNDLPLIDSFLGKASGDIGRADPAIHIYREDSLSSNDSGG